MSETNRTDSMRPDRGFGPLIACGCGCGETIRQFDQNGRIRRFKVGHYLKQLSRLYQEARAKSEEAMR